MELPSGNERIVSIHIEKTAGTSLLDFFCAVYGPANVYFFHPKSGFLRQDRDPARKRRSYAGDWIKSAILKFPFYYKTARRILHRKERQVADFTVPKVFSVIHGHFSPSDFSVSNASYVTVFRDPMQRTRSHFDDSNKWHQVLSVAKNELTFEEFALQETMINFQTKKIQDWDLNFFRHFGVTEKLDEYCRYFDPSQGIRPKMLNQTKRPSRISSSESFRKAYEITHSKDIQLYERVRKLLQ